MKGSSELKVGIFVTAALVIGGILVFVIGNRSAMFTPKIHYEAVFASVDGLRSGSPIRVAGLEVGTVDDVRFGDDGQVHVGLEISSDAAAFVREGSTARVGSKGLLGDQLVEITVGQGERLPPGSTIPAAQSSLLTTFLGATGRDAEGIVHNLNELSDALAQEQFRQDLQDIAHNIATLTRLIAENDGLARRLMTDPSLADDVQGTVVAFRTTGNELSQAARSVRAIAGEVQHGDGTAHGLIYGQEGLQLIGNLASTAGEAATILRDIRTGDNNAHALLYGDEAGDLIENLTAMSADLRAIVADVRAGRGTIGGLLVDPSIYEDVKRLVGNLERNEILRSLVRYSIREDRPREPAARPEVPEP